MTWAWVEAKGCRDPNDAHRFYLSAERTSAGSFATAKAARDDLAQHLATSPYPGAKKAMRDDRAYYAPDGGMMASAPPYTWVVHDFPIPPDSVHLAARYVEGGPNASQIAYNLLNFR